MDIVGSCWTSSPKNPPRFLGYFTYLLWDAQNMISKGPLILNATF
jgi:hypothetical protein